MTDEKEKPSVEEVGRAMRDIGVFIMLGCVLLFLVICMISVIFV